MNLLKLIVVSFVFIATSQAMAADLDGSYAGSVGGELCKISIEVTNGSGDSDSLRIIKEAYVNMLGEELPAVDDATLDAVLNSMVMVEMTPQTDCLSGKDKSVQFFSDVEGQLTAKFSEEIYSLSFINSSNGAGKIILQNKTNKDSSMALFTKMN